MPSHVAATARIRTVFLLGVVFVAAGPAGLAHAQPVVCDDCGTERRALEACGKYTAGANTLSVGYGHSTRWRCAPITRFDGRPAWVSHEVGRDPHGPSTGAAFHWRAAASPGAPKVHGVPVARHSRIR